MLFPQRMKATYFLQRTSHCLNRGSFLPRLLESNQSIRAWYPQTIMISKECAMISRPRHRATYKVEMGFLLLKRRTIKYSGAMTRDLISSQWRSTLCNRKLRVHLRSTRSTLFFKRKSILWLKTLRLRMKNWQRKGGLDPVEKDKRPRMLQRLLKSL